MTPYSQGLLENTCSFVGSPVSLPIQTPHSEGRQKPRVSQALTKQGLAGCRAGPWGEVVCLPARLPGGKGGVLHSPLFLSLLLSSSSASLRAPTPPAQEEGLHQPHLEVWGSTGDGPMGSRNVRSCACQLPGEVSVDLAGTPPLGGPASSGYTPSAFVPSLHLPRTKKARWK